MFAAAKRALYSERNFAAALLELMAATGSDKTYLPSDFCCLVCKLKLCCSADTAKLSQQVLALKGQAKGQSPAFHDKAAGSVVQDDVSSAVPSGMSGSFAMSHDQSTVVSDFTSGEPTDNVSNAL